MTSTHTGTILNDLSFVSTVVDGAVAFARGDRASGVFLLAAAALSRRIPGLGTLASLFVRLARRLR